MHCVLPGFLERDWVVCRGHNMVVVTFSFCLRDVTLLVLVNLLLSDLLQIHLCDDVVVLDVFVHHDIDVHRASCCFLDLGIGHKSTHSRIMIILTKFGGYAIATRNFGLTLIECMASLKTPVADSLGFDIVLPFQIGF